MAPLQVLQGDLHVQLRRAEKLYNDETLGAGVLGKAIAKVGRLKIDPYVNFIIGESKLGTSVTIDNTMNPTWDETFHFTLCHRIHVGENDRLVIHIKDKNPAGAKLVGELQIGWSDLAASPGGVMDPPDGFPLRNPSKGQRGRLFMRLQFTRFDPLGPHAPPEVPGVYFRAVPGNSVRLYQSADTTPATVPQYLQPGTGEPWPVHSCWADVYAAITQAQKFIFLTGWSVHPLTRLLRGGSGSTGAAACPPIGELLKAACERGVVVKVMVWDDRSSVSVPVLKNIMTGVMGTFDEELRSWFAANAPAVQVALVAREGDDKQSLFEGLTAAASFSHHQKTVACDVAGADGRSREMVAFVGGLDITLGRYDTGDHRIIVEGDSRFDGDWYQASWSNDNGGKRPRQPWADIHCRIHGPAAGAVVDNFVERWAQQVTANITPPSQLGCVLTQFPNDPEAFSAQILRSCDSRSALFDPAREGHLHCKKGRSVDRSIYLAYVHHIRRAQHFVYIENQYFLGSCFEWAASKDVGCSHTVCAELTQKICAKIRAGERFTAYVVQPMFPEGDPYAESVQAILRFQQLTMQFMFQHVSEAISEAGAATQPTDYLNFFCLGNREAGPRGEEPSPGAGKPELGALSEANRRFMVYVHSKFMVVDDEVAIIGSANVNMRSLAGTRDTEIATALWQPAHMAWPEGKRAQPRGQVHSFRMSVWREHMANASVTNADVALMMDPTQLRCVRRVQQLAEENWALYTGEQNVDMAGHLMPYPVAVTYVGGRVELQPRVKDVVDFPGASMAGGKSKLPNVLTT